MSSNNTKNTQPTSRPTCAPASASSPNRPKNYNITISYPSNRTTESPSYNKVIASLQIDQITWSIFQQLKYSLLC